MGNRRSKAGRSIGSAPSLRSCRCGPPRVWRRRSRLAALQLNGLSSTYLDGLNSPVWCVEASITSAPFEQGAARRDGVGVIDLAPGILLIAEDFFEKARTSADVQAELSRRGASPSNIELGNELKALTAMGFFTRDNKWISLVSGMRVNVVDKAA